MLWNVQQKKTMYMLSNGQIDSEPSSEEENEDVEVELDALKGDLLMIRRLLGSKMQALDQTQRENIFHTRCSIQGKICSLIVDGGSCTNVDGRGPSTSPHASPPKDRFGPTIELWPRGSKKTFFYMFKCHKL